MKLFRYVFVVSILLGSNLSYAFKANYSIGELKVALENTLLNGETVANLISDNVLNAVNDAGLELREGDLVFSLDFKEESVSTGFLGGCDRMTAWGDAELTIGDDTRMEFTLSSLNKPIEAYVDVVGHLDGDGHLQITSGQRILWKCVKGWQDTTHSAINADLSVSMRVKLTLMDENDYIEVDENGDEHIVLEPKIEITGDVNLFNTDIDVSGHLVGGVVGDISAPLDFALEEVVLNHIMDGQGSAYVNSKYQEFMQNKASDLLIEIKDKLGMESDETTKKINISDIIRNIDEGDIAKMTAIVAASRIATFPVTREFINDNKEMIMYYLLVGDYDKLKELLASGGACLMAVQFVDDGVKKPNIWHYSNGYCSQIGFDDNYSGTFYSDSNCQSQVNFSPEDMARFCTIVADPEKATLGNPQKWVFGEETNWTVSPGTRFDITVNSIEGNTQPLIKKESYKSIYYPDLFEINPNKIDNEFYDIYQFDPLSNIPVPNGNPLSSNSINALDRQEVFDLCVEMSKSLGGSMVRVMDINDPLNTSYGHISCIPGQEIMENPDYVPEYNGSYGTFEITQHTQLPPKLTHSNNSYILNDVVIQDFGFFRMATVAKVDVTQDSYYYHALNMIEQYGIPHGAVVKAQENYTCDLEMRVYKKDINATNLKPLLAIHGGAWKYRGFAFAGLESQISHLTEQGFAVFAPFYRLAGESEGNTECNGYTWEDITSDAESALDWVIAHGSVFGANVNNGVAVFGQSAGGHLGGWLAVNQPSKVSKAMLMYPPVDFEHYITETQYGNIYNEQGKAIIETFIGDTFDKLDVYGAEVQANSFPQTIAGNPNAYPPVYLIHGSSDDLVPVEQSVRMCAAYNGSVASSLVQNPDGSYACGTNGGVLNIIPGAEHALEICVDGAVCLAGNESKAREAIDNGVQWLAQ